MIPHRNIIKDTGRILFWYPLRWLLLLMPFSIISVIGNFLGRLDYLFSGSERIKKMARNMAHVFNFNTNERELKKIIRKNLQNHCKNVLEFVKYPQLNNNNIKKILTFEGIDILNKELTKGRGVILATAHFGAKQLLQVGLGLKGYKINQIHYHMSEEELTYVQKRVSQKQRIKIEEKIPATFIPANSFLRSAFDCLKKNEILVMAADGIGLPEHMKKGYTPFKFLGKSMLFPSNIPSLAKRTGSSILPIFVIRQKDNKHKIMIKHPININSQSEIDITLKFIKILENYILQYPYLWEFWEEFEEGTLIVASDEQKTTVGGSLDT